MENKEGQKLTPDLLSRCTRVFMNLIRRTDPLIKEDMQRLLVGETLAAPIPPEPPAPAPVPKEPPRREKSPIELLMEEYEREENRRQRGQMQYYAPDQLEIVQIRLPRHQLAMLTELCKLHSIYLESIMISLVSGASVGELELLARRLRANVDQRAAQQNQPQGDQS